MFKLNKKPTSLSSLNPDYIFINNQRYLEVWSELDSTSSRLKQLLQQKELAPGCGVLARHQISGRGQVGNSWWDKSGQSVLLSLHLVPGPWPIHEAFGWNMAVSLTIRQVLVDFGLSVVLKWPNDLLVNGKKLGGILLENSWQGGLLQSSQVGIGLNVQESEFPESLPHAISWSQVQGQTPAVEEIAVHLCEALAGLRFGRDWEFGPTKARYLAVLYGFRTEVAVRIEQKTTRVRVVDVEVTGRIGLQHADEPAVYYDLKEISWVL